MEKLPYLAIICLLCDAFAPDSSVTESKSLKGSTDLRDKIGCAGSDIVCHGRLPWNPLPVGP